MITLRAGEAILLHPEEDEPTFLREFMEDRDYGPVMLDLHYRTGENWESEETEDGGFTVRTKPDPNVHVRTDGEDHIVMLVVSMPDPMVWGVFRLGRDVDIGQFLARMTESLDESFDGIYGIDVETASGLYRGLGERQAARFDGE